jgi:phosphopantothenoylcysteine decarboxylase / phosphopantothenate---cysteine ligase
MNNILKNKKILLGVCGSIAAYKSPLLVRELVKQGALVQVVMTPSAKEFVSPLVLKNLSRSDVAINMFGDSEQSAGAWHIELAHWCDLMMIAPASASSLGKIANGICDNALTAVALALPRETPFMLSPAMDSTMWLHPATQRNVGLIDSYGGNIIPPEEGELSSGIVGPGRMPEIGILVNKINAKLSSGNYTEKKKTVLDNIVEVVESTNHAQREIDEALSQPAKPIAAAIEEDKLNSELEFEMMKERILSSNISPDLLKGKRILITAGPTYEKIDDVRFIGNYSSGKMGHALATEARKMGAEVTIVCGPITLITPPGVRRIDVESASEMYKEVSEAFPQSHIAILSAAVADYAPKEKTDGKIKKEDTGDSMTIELSTTRDILATLGTQKQDSQVLIGFALESTNEIENGRKKLIKKNADMIVVNSANKPQSGFGGNDNTITVLRKDDQMQPYPPMSKLLCARIILQSAKEILDTKS